MFGFANEVWESLLMVESGSRGDQLPDLTRMKLASHFTSCLFSFDVREAMKRGVNRPTDRRILKIILLGFRIQSEISTDLRILNLQRFTVSSIFWVRILDFACEEVRIVDRKGCQKCVVSGYVYFFVTAGRDSLHVTHQGNNNELWPA